MAKKKKDMCTAKEAEKDYQEASSMGNGESGNIVPLLPQDFTARMRKMLPPDEYEEFLSSYGKKRRFSLRINPLKVSREAFEALTEDFVREEDSGSSGFSGSPGSTATGTITETITETMTGTMTETMTGTMTETITGTGRDRRLFSPVPWDSDGFYYEEELRPGRHPRHEAGMYYIQEASAMVPAVLCGAQPGERVLDLCAAPGGKSTKLGASLRGEGVLVANEIHAGRAKILSSNIERMGIRNAVVTNEPPQRLSSRFPSYFDRIVVDAPCSGEGMFRKEEEALRHWSLENVRMCAKRQMEILEEAAVMLRPGGTLVYSTCTFAPEEDEGVIGAFLAAHPEFSIRRIQEMPGLDMEGWGFEPGHPEWAQMTAGGNAAALSAEENDTAIPAEGSSAERTPANGNSLVSSPEVNPAYENTDKRESGRDAQKRVPAGLDGTVRLWPHRLDGEGHFAAVLQKRDLARVTSEPSADTDEGGLSEDTAVLAMSADRSPEKHKSGSRAAAGTGSDINEKKKEKRIKRKRTGGGKSPQDSGLSQMIRLWREFRDDVLVPSETLSEKSADSLTGDDGSSDFDGSCPESAVEGGALFGEKNLLLFGESLYALPFPADTMSFEGMRILRPGLQLGTAVKGRFVPFHSLGMALRREEVRRAVDLPGASPAASAWFRGESIPLPADCEKGWTLVLIDGCAAGWGKAVGSMLKNHYPKGLRRNMRP